MTTRVELPLKGTPCFVQFTDERDPRTVRIVMTYSKTKPAEVVLRFFVQPTEDRVTTGIMNHLPWLRSLPSRVLNGGPGAFREKNFKSPRDADQVTDHEFVDRETAKQLNDARNSKM